MTHKFGIRFPKTFEEALHIEKDQGKYYWEKALNKDISNVNVS